MEQNDWWQKDEQEMRGNPFSSTTCKEDVSENPFRSRETTERTGNNSWFETEEVMDFTPPPNPFAPRAKHETGVIWWEDEQEMTENPFA